MTDKASTTSLHSLQQLSEERQLQKVAGVPKGKEFVTAIRFYYSRLV